MNAFIVDLENRPGLLAGLAESIAARGINITAVAAATATDRGQVAVLTDDEEGTRSALDDAGVTFRTCRVVSAALEHRPGSLADAARRLATAGINVEAMLVTGLEADRVTVAFAVDDADGARAALGDLARA